MFHVVTAIAPRNSCRRVDCEIDQDVERAAMAYASLLPLTKGDVTVDFPDVNLKAHIYRLSRSGSALLNFEVTGIIGMPAMVLSGCKDKVDAEYAIRFTKRMKSGLWQLPLPPLEIISRPLFYYAVIRLGGPDGNEWFSLVSNVVKKANGLGVALLRSANCKV